jgi:hypothetical protein
MLSTGTVIGAGASVHGPGAPPRWIPPFAWGLTGMRMTLEGFVGTAERVMTRREVPLTQPRRDSLLSLYRRGTEDPA